MKKSLIALAALAAFGTASAQSNVTMSGNINFGFAGDTTTAGVKTRGFGGDTTNITLSVSEDLGGGLKATGSMSLENFNEDAATNGNNASLGLSGGFGSLVFSSSESADWLPVDGLTASSNGTNGDRINYTSPTINGLTFGFQTQDDLGVIDADAGETIGKATGISISYTTGPLTVEGAYSLFSGLTAIDNRKQLRASYDFGVAKVTYGMLNEYNDVTTANRTETGLTIAAPVGPVTVTYGFATAKVGTAKSLSGSSLAASYPFSKRTSLAFATESYQSNGVSNVKEYSLLLKHSF